MRIAKDGLRRTSGVYLFSDLIICVSHRKKMGKKTVAVSLTSENDHVHVNSLPDYENGIMIANYDDSTLLQLIFPDETQQKEWLEEIQKLVNIKRIKR